MAFSDYETGQIRRALLREAQRCAVTLGMRKTSVEQLTQAVGISKGSFYRFYDSKELLFFAVLEDIHTEIYEVADNVLCENAGLAPAERVTKAILACCRRLSDTGAMVFIENDADALLERLPGTLYAHGLIRHQMHVTPVADTQMNVRFGLSLPQK